jgi:peroxiredoxin Q/BCP
VKKAAKKASRKAGSAKKTVKKAAKKVSKAAKKVAKKVAKKATKKVAKKVAKKATRGAAKKGGSLKSKAKKAVKKVIAPAKKAVKKIARKARSTRKNNNAIGVLSNTVSNMVKDALVTVIEKATPERSESNDSGSSASEKGSGEEEEEERRPRLITHRTKLRAGNMAPYFEGVDHSGRKVSLYSLSGKTIILYFYPKDDTEGCTATSCNLRDEYNYLTEYNYAVVGVSADDEASHQRFAKKYNLPFPLLADTDKTIIKAYDVWGPKEKAGRIAEGIVRTTFLIDCYGMIRHVITDVDTANHAQQILAL